VSVGSVENFIFVALAERDEDVLPQWSFGSYLHFRLAWSLIVSAADFVHFNDFPGWEERESLVELEESSSISLSGLGKGFFLCRFYGFFPRPFFEFQGQVGEGGEGEQDWNLKGKVYPSNYVITENLAPENQFTT